MYRALYSQGRHSLAHRWQGSVPEHLVFFLSLIISVYIDPQTVNCTATCKFAGVGILFARIAGSGDLPARRGVFLGRQVGGLALEACRFHVVRRLRLHGAMDCSRLCLFQCFWGRRTVVAGGAKVKGLRGGVGGAFPSPQSLLLRCFFRSSFFLRSSFASFAVYPSSWSTIQHISTQKTLSSWQCWLQCSKALLSCIPDSSPNYSNTISSDERTISQ